MEPKWSIAKPEEHEALPPRKPAKKLTPWDHALSEIEAGNVVHFSIADEDERTRVARSLGRRASLRKVPIDVRYGDNVISVKRDDSAQPKKRRRKTADAALVS